MDKNQPTIMSLSERDVLMTENPWGNDSGPKSDNPWGDRNSRNSKKNSAMDLESLISQFQKQFKQLLPQGGSGNLNIFFLILGVALALWLSTGFYYVSEKEVGIEQRFGKYVNTTYSGLRYHLPAPFETATVLNVTQINQIASGIQVKSNTALMGEESDNLMLTRDENILAVTFSVSWFIKDPVKHLFTDPNPQQTVKLAAESAVREIIAQNLSAEILTTAKGKIVQDAQKLLQKLLDEYEVGIEIQKINLTSAKAPSQVTDAYRDVQSARADRESKINEAKAYQNSIIPEARGQAQQIIQNAEAYRQSVIAAAEGQSERFMALLKEYQAAPEITWKRLYIDHMTRILQGVNKIIMEGNSQNVLPYLPLPELQKKLKSIDVEGTKQ